MNRSTLAFAYNISGFYDPALAARFGAIAFDSDNARELWLSAIPNGSSRVVGLRGPFLQVGYVLKGVSQNTN